MKALKVILGIVLGIILILVLLLVVAFVYVDKLAKTGVEDGATYALAVPTTLDSADVGIFDGTFKMQGLEIANPEGYDSPFFLRLESGGVEVSLQSLLEDVVQLPSLTLTNLDVHIDGVTGTSNVKKILENLKEFEAKLPAPEREPKKFVVDQIDIETVTIHVHLLPLPGQISTQKVIVPEIKLTDIGSAGDPVTLAELSNIITQAVLKSAEQFGDGIIPPELLAELDMGLDQLNDLAENGVDMITSEVDEIIKDTTQELNEEIDRQVEDLKGEAEDAINEGLDKVFGNRRGREPAPPAEPEEGEDEGGEGDGGGG